MFGRWLGNRSSRGGRSGPLSAVTVPPSAGVLSCRVLDPVNEPVRHAELSVTDTMGRKVVSGGTDPFGSFVTTVPAGEYRLAVSAEGFTPYRANVTVGEGAHASMGDVTLQVAQLPTLPESGDWDIDPMHSTIGFTARHIGLARIHGRFNTFAGAIRLAERMEDSAMHVVIDAASIDTAVKMRDDHLRSGDFLDVERFPTMEFYGDRFVHKGGNRWAITGALSLHGVTRTVTLDTEYLGVGQGIQGETRAACRATTELHRDDFTITWQTMLARGIAAVGASITIELDIQIVPKSAAEAAAA
ncbi:YceI family protein [Streptomyces spectabilis]|uniref:PEGA domain-containing protein n=1 Tax=Streptomyces spectabilis TaxID=68270 RepID=A0A5P2XBW4_STRST|nr:YceI family protein [Streptomyces spectabilis]MCI3902653.1 YceI family protein [Streptomyces spectabilis]QEV59972.1 PEGA domain-containing protein [Streptomyces spectabilis]